MRGALVVRCDIGFGTSRWAALRDRPAARGQLATRQPLSHNRQDQTSVAASFCTRDRGKMKQHSGGAALQPASLIGAYRGTSFTSSLQPDAARFRHRHFAPRRGWELAVKLKGNPLALRHLFENEDAIRAGHAAAAPRPPDRDGRWHVLHPRGRLLDGMARRRAWSGPSTTPSRYRAAAVRWAPTCPACRSGPCGCSSSWRYPASSPARPWYRRRLSLAHLASVLRGRPQPHRLRSAPDPRATAPRGTSSSPGCPATASCSMPSWPGRMPPRRFWRRAHFPRLTSPIKVGVGDIEGESGGWGLRHAAAVAGRHQALPAGHPHCIGQPSASQASAALRAVAVADVRAHAAFATCRSACAAAPPP